MMGQRLVKLQIIHGFAVQTTAASVIQVASFWGIPLSTTHVISASILGVGATRRLNAVNWGIASQMVWAWILTLPTTALIGYLAESLLPI
jgi:PiT family inorganic phosphate transporter